MADNSFSGMVSKIKNTICKHGVYMPFISFTVLNTVYGDFRFTTSEFDRCMITSFENVKNGSGKANSFSITLSFSPSTSLFYRTNGIDYSNINLIDEILNLNKETSTASKDKDGNPTGNTLRKCKIQYGYSYPELILSPVYEGVILDYTTEISNGILIYTITGYSGVISCKDIIVTIEGSGEGEDAKTKKPTAIVKDVFEKYMKEEGSTDYKLEFAKDTEGTDKEIAIPAAQNVSIFQYIKTVLDSAEYSENDENTPAEERSTYTYTISDKDKKIIVERYDPMKKQEESVEKNAVRFSWMGPSEKDSGYDYASNAMVIDFKTNFKGSVSMAFDYSKYVKTKSGINSSGESVKASGTSVPTAGSNTENDNATNLNLWATRLQYLYTATLITIGIPYEVKILSNIYVAPMILGQEHFTGGLYKITKITDVIDTSGFTTTFELARNQAPNLKNKYNELKEHKKNLGTPSNASDGQRMLELNRKMSEYEALDPDLTRRD